MTHCISEWVPSERESDKNITIIHSPLVNIWRRQKLKQIIKIMDYELVKNVLMLDLFQLLSSPDVN